MKAYKHPDQKHLRPVFSIIWEKSGEAKYIDIAFQFWHWTIYHEFKIK